MSERSGASVPDSPTPSRGREDYILRSNQRAIEAHIQSMPGPSGAILPGEHVIITPLEGHMSPRATKNKIGSAICPGQGMRVSAVQRRSQSMEESGWQTEAREQARQLSRRQGQDMLQPEISPDTHQAIKMATTTSLAMRIQAKNDIDELLQQRNDDRKIEGVAPEENDDPK